MYDQSGTEIAYNEVMWKHTNQVPAPIYINSGCTDQYITDGWGMGIFPITVSAPYNPSMGDITVEITTSLDQAPNDEAIGFGNVQF